MDKFLAEIISIDRHAFLWLNERLGSSFLDILFFLLTQLGNGLFLGLLVLMLLIWRDPEGLKRHFFFLLIAGLIGGICVQVIKELLPRPRPVIDLLPLIPEGKVHLHNLFRIPKHGSFPSGHAQTIFAISTYLWLMYRRYAVLLLVFSSMVAFSRVYLSVHYPIDVLCGALIGAGFSILIWKIQWRLSERFKKKIEGSLYFLNPANLLKIKGLHVPVLVLVGGLIFFTHLGQSSLWDDDEPRNSEAAREMLEVGDWVVPYMNYELRTDKPALLYWLMFISYSIFGVNEFSARFWSPIFGILTVLATYLFARRFFGDRAAFMAGTILMSSLIFSVSSRSAVPDALLIFFINSAIYSFFIAFNGVSKWWYRAFYAFMAMAFLAKGPMGIVIPCLSSILYLMFKNEPISIRKFRVFEGIGIFFLIVFPWFFAVTIKTDGEFFRGFFLHHNITRYLEPLEKHEGPPVYYFLVLIFAFLPWSGLLPQMVLHVKGYDGSEIGREVIIYLRLWIVMFILFFSIARTKLPTYIIPVIPAISILMGKMLDSWIESSGTPSFRRIGMSLLLNGIIGLLVMGGLATGAIILLPDKWPLCLIGLVLVGGSFLTTILFSRKDYGNGVIVNSAMGMIFVLLLVVKVLPEVEIMRPIKSMSLIIQRERGKEDIEVASFRCYKPSMTFYLRGYVHRLHNIEDAVDFIETVEDRKFYIFTLERYLDLLMKNSPTPLFVISGRDGFDIPGRIVLLSNRPYLEGEAWR